ncbi:hypothetical protein AGLY_013711 [Aphis glycines]|uniref:Uncharacterized protein n=1 Tax=Aphis glycines TaxID=307491 RepID=A0A6G0T7Y7_APHGL|nr:hypothetical protein AGLY_013711 [Aphis glycines]
MVLQYLLDITYYLVDSDSKLDLFGTFLGGGESKDIYLTGTKKSKKYSNIVIFIPSHLNEITKLKRISSKKEIALVLVTLKPREENKFFKFCFMEKGKNARMITTPNKMQKRGSIYLYKNKLLLMDYCCEVLTSSDMSFGLDKSVVTKFAGKRPSGCLSVNPFHQLGSEESRT